ncbi:hypothetical protein BDAP_002657 [Binucleata daphniae]
MGAVERANKSLFEKIKKLNNYKESDWEQQVEKATYAQNISYHRGLRASPYLFKYGKMPLFNNVEFENQNLKTHTRDELLDERNKHIEHYQKKYIEKGQKGIKETYS